MKKAYLDGELDGFLDNILVNYQPTKEDIDQIHKELESIREECKSTRDIILEEFKDYLVSEVNMIDIVQDDEEKEEIKKSIKALKECEKSIEKFVEIKADGDRTIKRSMTPETANDIALKIINNMKNLKTYEEHLESKYREVKKYYIEQRHYKSKTAEDLARCSKEYADFIKIKIWREVLEETELLLKARTKIFN